MVWGKIFRFDQWFSRNDTFSSAAGTRCARRGIFFMEICKWVNCVCSQNFTSIPLKMRSLSTKKGKLRLCNFLKNAPLWDLSNACRCPYSSIIEALRGRRRAIRNAATSWLWTFKNNLIKNFRFIFVGEDGHMRLRCCGKYVTGIGNVPVWDPPRKKRFQPINHDDTWFYDIKQSKQTHYIVYFAAWSHAQWNKDNQCTKLMIWIFSLIFIRIPNSLKYNFNNKEMLAALKNTIILVMHTYKMVLKLGAGHVRSQLRIKWTCLSY